jgi:hypothetical protein
MMIGAFKHNVPLTRLALPRSRCTDGSKVQLLIPVQRDDTTVIAANELA